MNTEDEQNSRQEILSKIKGGKVDMHSRAYLNFRSVLWILAISILALAGIFIASFIVFALQASGVWDLPRFGAHGLQEFLIYFPWLFVPAAILFIWLLERVILKHSPAYRVPVLYSSLGLIIFIVLASFAVSLSPLHYDLYESARNESLPIAGEIYRFFGDSHPDDFYVGDVESVTGASYNILTREGYPATIVVGSHTVFSGDSNIKAGDCIEVVGEENGNIVEAYNIKKIPPDSLYPIRHFQPAH
jgi:hypothetical protein